MGNKHARLNSLVDILRVHNNISVKELAAMLGVSEMTIRRDLKVLQQNEIAERTDDSAVLSSTFSAGQMGKEYNLLLEAQAQNEEKAAIGKFAASLVQPNETIIIDTGTTTVHVARNLPLHQNISALCYNANILLELLRFPNINLLFAGGYYHANAQMFECAQGIDFIRSIRVHKAFISAAGIHENLGITCLNSYEVDTKRTILKSSLQKILVADSNKFGVIHSSYFCDLDAIDMIITDRALSLEWVEIIKRHKIQLFLV